VRIALTCPYDWGAPGGVQVHVAQLASHLRRRGHETLILAPGRTTEADEGVAIVGRPLPIRYQGTVAPIALSPKAIRRVRATLRSFRPDVVHAHEPLTPSISMFATLAAQVPVVATFHAHAERSRLLTVAAPILRPVWRRLSVRLAVSDAAARFVGARFEGDIRIIPNGVDVDAFAGAHPADGLPPGRRMLWVGRLDPQKGFPVAVMAFGVLAPDFPELSFVVAGDGRDRGAAGSLAVQARRRLVMLGAVPNDVLPLYHAAADVFVAPALGQESFGIVLVEAMAAGVPVVASDIAGYREVVRPDVDGLLVRPGDAQALAMAVRRVLTDPPLAERLVAAGKARAERYAWPAVADQIEDAYSEAISAGKRNRG
jgi:phosphatidylinositol alpha-mannosyltransferase